jgi:hypothetical protein
MLMVHFGLILYLTRENNKPFDLLSSLLCVDRLHARAPGSVRGPALDAMRRDEIKEEMNKINQ